MDNKAMADDSTSAEVEKEEETQSPSSALPQAIEGRPEDGGDTDHMSEDMVDEDRDPDYVPLVRTSRRSERLKKKDRWDFNFYRRNRDNNRIWEEREKKTFYEAIKKYGTREWRKVAACLPSKSEDVVRSWIQREKRNQMYKVERRIRKPDGTYEKIDGSAKKSKEEEDTVTPDQIENIEIEEVLTKIDTLAPMDKWIEIIEENFNKENKKRERQGQSTLLSGQKIVPMSLRWIAEFEPHPSPEKCGGIDYAAIYRYFAHLSEGEVPPDLDPVSAARVTRLLSDVGVLARESALPEEEQYLGNYRGTFTRYKTSERFDAKIKSAKMLAEVSKVPGFNPLNLHIELFTNRDIDVKSLIVRAKKFDEMEETN